jgi:hypothetical protein
MTQDEISELARKAGLFGTFVKYKNEIETFAKLVVEKERKWVGLTDDEIYKITFVLEGEHWKKIRAIEARLKEKNT